VALAVGMCKALELWDADRHRRAAELCRLRDRFEAAILHGWPNTVVMGHDAPRVPQTSNIAFVGLDRQALFMAIDQAGVACSTGSACASGSSEPSPALVAMGRNRAEIGGALRFSLGVTTTDRDVDEAARRILLCCKDLGQNKKIPPDFRPLLLPPPCQFCYNSGSSFGTEFFPFRTTGWSLQ
jgi:cysteine desulfurase